MPLLAGAAIDVGATRETAKPFFLSEITHYVYGGDTALHVAAAAYRLRWCACCSPAASDPSRRNKRGARAAALRRRTGVPIDALEPKAQAKTIALLVKAGADPNITDTKARRHYIARCARARPARCRRSSKAGANPKLKNARARRRWRSRRRHGSRRQRLARSEGGAAGNSILLGLRDKKKKKPQKQKKATKKRSGR